jgi:hypothetical protein
VAAYAEACKIRRMNATHAGASHPVLLPLVTAILLAAGVGRASDAEKKASPELTCPEGMVLIPGGSFPLGGKKMVKVKAFCLDETVKSRFLCKSYVA